MQIDQNTPTFEMEAFGGTKYEYAFVPTKTGCPELVARDTDGVLKSFNEHFICEMVPSLQIQGGAIFVGSFPPASLRLLADKLEEYLAANTETVDVDIFDVRATV